MQLKAVTCIINPQKESVNPMYRRMTALVLFLCLCFALLPLNITAEEISVEVDKQALLSALYEGDISTVREAIDQRLISCRELTEYYLSRIEEYDDPYNCFITICSDALQQADARDAQLAAGEGEGLLFGIPIVVKDNIDVEGIHTTNGHNKTSSQIAKDNAEVVQKLMDAGAIILAKANMSKDAQSAYDSKSDFGETKNAYSPYFSAGGSSGGSAVSVSLNFAMASLGTDTNSSLRLPAALAGCYSLRPTFDLTSLDGVIQLNSTRDTVGSITRSAKDLAIMMDVLTDGQYQYAQNYNPNVLQGLRLGIVKELTYPTSQDSSRTEENIDDEVAAAFDRAVQELRACGVEIVEVSFRDIFYYANKTLNSNASSLKDQMYAEYLKVLAKYDVSALIYPTYLSTPLRSGKDENGKNWNVYSQVFINNCRTLAPSAKLPEITIPIGQHSLGPGIGLEIAAPRNSEQLLLNIAMAYAEKYDHRIAPTGAPDGYADASMGSMRDVLDDYYARLEAAKNPPTEPAPQPSPTPAQPEEKGAPAFVIFTFMLSALIFAAHAYDLRLKPIEKIEDTEAQDGEFEEIETEEASPVP